MKNIFKSFIIALAAVSMFSACVEKEEGPVDPYSVNWTYLRPKELPTKTSIVTDGGELVSMFSTTDTLLSYVQCTKPAPKNITATFAIDESLIEAYNTANNRNCKLMENVSLVNNTLTVEVGQYISADTLKITYDVEAIKAVLLACTEPAEFVLPITMTSVSDGGTMSETRTMFIHYEVLIKSAEQADAPFGVKTDITSAVVTLNGKVTTTLNDGDDYWDEYFKNPSEVIVDFGKELRVQSISIIPYAWYYMFKEVSVSFSTDGTNYTEPASFSLYQAYDYYLNFYSAKTARYVKLNTSGFIYSSSYSPYICELEFYIAE